MAADQRSLYPHLYRDLGLLQARLGQTPAAVESLKSYILGHVTRTSTYPDDLDQMYDYLLAFGDAKWTAPTIDSVIVRPSTPASPGACDTGSVAGRAREEDADAPEARAQEAAGSAAGLVTAPGD